MSGFEPICEKCEERLQPYLDRELSDVERLEAEVHLEECDYCGKRYRFEISLRRYVRSALGDAPSEGEMTPELKAKLANLRIADCEGRSSLARYERSLRPCLGTIIAPATSNIPPDPPSPAGRR